MADGLFLRNFTAVHNVSSNKYISCSMNIYKMSHIRAIPGEAIRTYNCLFVVSAVHFVLYSTGLSSMMLI